MLGCMSLRLDFPMTVAKPRTCAESLGANELVLVLYMRALILRGKYNVFVVGLFLAQEKHGSTSMQHHACRQHCCKHMLRPLQCYAGQLERPLARPAQSGRPSVAKPDAQRLACWRQ